VKTNTHVLIISPSFLLRMLNISDKNSRENQNTHFSFNNFVYESRVVYEKVQKYCRAKTTDDITWRKYSACWITKATNTHSEYVILVACPRHKMVTLTRLISSLLLLYRVQPRGLCVFPRHFKPDIWFLLTNRRTMFLINGGPTVFHIKGLCPKNVEYIHGENDRPHSWMRSIY
jgi:hypothetical protein